MGTGRSREIARDAVRERITQIALEEVLERGFANVTISDLAEAAGVSRSTFLRHAGSKGDAIVNGLGAFGIGIANRLRVAPADTAWARLRAAVDVVVESNGIGAPRILDLVQAVRANVALSGALALQRESWRAGIADSLRQRDDRLTAVQAEALAASALACMDVAVIAWADSNGERSLRELLDESFAAVVPEAC